MPEHAKEGSPVVQRKRPVLRVACVLFSMAVPIAAFAQGITGTLSGGVKDIQGGVIPGASVTVTDEAQGTRTAPVVTNATGDFVVPNLAAGTYTVLVEMPLFKSLSKPGVVVGAGSHVSVGTLVIEIGGTSEMVTVTSEIPLIQTTSGERSFNVTTESVTSLPLQNRSYFGLLALAPGVVPASGNTVVTRLGGGGGNNYMVDGTNTMDPSVNRPMQIVSVEAVAEVKAETSTYSAEYGRSSGVQVNAVTKSGTNVLHGSLYDVERNSKWNSNNAANILNGTPKPLVDERDYGFALGGPIGKPGGHNKLFFYLNYERNPRVYNQGEVNSYRMPTALERQGDFSQSLDNNGNPYPYIKDYLKTGSCNATSQAACFNDGGVVGRIPANRLYQTGLAVLNWWPLPNIPSVAGTAYNYQLVRPGTHVAGYEPVLKVDYQPTQTLRGSFKYLEYGQATQNNLGTIPGWNDGIAADLGTYALSSSINWTVNNKTFVEGNWGKNWLRQRGCGGLAGGSPHNCTGNATDPIANPVTAGFGNLPWIYPDQWVPEPGTLFRAGSIELAQLGNVWWDGTRLRTPQTFSWGSRVASAFAPPNNAYSSSGDLSSHTWTVSATLTRVQGSHTLKAGYFEYNTFHIQGNTKAPNQGLSFANDTSNIFDTTFGFANAATGVFDSYAQDSRYEEGAWSEINREAFVQDNWKVSKRVTLDYGLRFVNASPVVDTRRLSANFLPERWVPGNAPVLYQAGCSTGVYPCAASARVALNPVTGQLLGVNSSQFVGTPVPGTGDSLDGVFAQGKGISDQLYVTKKLALGPRIGGAWDVRGNQRLVLRGGAGLFFDRTNINNMYSTVKNPPYSTQTTILYGQLQNLSAEIPPTSATALSAIQYNYPTPYSVQWNGGVQVAVPFSMVVDVAYTGQHSNHGQETVNPNSIDLGMAFLPQYQNPAAATSATSTDPTTSYAATNPNVVRFYRGYGVISELVATQDRTYHSIQLSLNRRLKHGLSFGFYDTMGLSDKQNSPARLQHNADGTVTLRSDQAQADALLGNQNPQSHFLRANFTWVLPKLSATHGAMRAVGLVVNNWSLSGIWNGATGTKYAVSASYQNGGGNINLTGSPDYAARVVVLPNVSLGGGCSSDPLHQFNTSAFVGPAVGSVGLESGNGYLTGCFISSIDLALARTITLGKGRTIQLRADVFNAFNQAGITGRNTTMNLTSPADPVTITNLPNATTGVRTLPTGAGFGVATTYQDPRTVQLQIRIAF